MATELHAKKEINPKLCINNHPRDDGKNKAKVCDHKNTPHKTNKCK